MVLDGRDLWAVMRRLYGMVAIFTQVESPYLASLWNSEDGETVGHSCK
jgi:hypothetical protein